MWIVAGIGRSLGSAGAAAGGGVGFEGQRMLLTALRPLKRTHLHHHSLLLGTHLGGGEEEVVIGEGEKMGGRWA